MRRRRRIAFLLLTALLADCVDTRRPAPTPPAVAEDGYSCPADLQGARPYRIAPGGPAWLHVLVYRDGAMANLGHNHVISTDKLSGCIWLHRDSLARSGFAVMLRVHDLVVDSPQARLVEGPDFAARISEEARIGTRANMLKQEQLDAEHYPQIRLRSVAITGTRSQPQVRTQITIKNQSREVEVPVRLWDEGYRNLRVEGEFQIKLTDFGITPYSVALGALRVRDELTIKFRLIAAAAATSE